MFSYSLSLQENLLKKSNIDIIKHILNFLKQKLE